MAVDTPIVSAETDAIEIIGSDQLVPRPNDQEIQTEQPEGLYEIIAPESSEDGPRDRTGQESAYTEPTFSPEEPDGETDGLEAEMPLSFTAESHPADIYADQEPAVSLGQAEDLLSLLAESVDECRALGDESLDGVLDEIVTKIEAISASADTAPEVPDIFRYEATGTMFEQEAAENLEELEELFPLLIEAVSAERSPKLVKLFVRLTAVQAEMGTKRAGENRKPAAGGIGTHETIRQLILTLKSMNSIQDRLRHIGDSAIRLFLGFDTPPGSKRLLQVV